MTYIIDLDKKINFGDTVECKMLPIRKFDDSTKLFDLYKKFDELFNKIEKITDDINFIKVSNEDKIKRQMIIDQEINKKIYAIYEEIDKIRTYLVI